MVRQIEVRIEPFERTAFLLVDLRDLERRGDHAAGHMLDVRSGKNPRGRDPSPDLVGRTWRPMVPRDASWSLTRTPLLHGSLRRTIITPWADDSRVVAFGEHVRWRCITVGFAAGHRPNLGEVLARPQGSTVLA